MAKNMDDEKTQREREEDLLEFIYSLWRQEKEISVTEYVILYVPGTLAFTFFTFVYLSFFSAL